jgi:hypothetical protein
MVFTPGGFMTPVTSDEGQAKHAASHLGSVAEELQRESEKLRLLAEKLKVREEALAEMEANYPYFKRFVYAKLREEFERTVEELPHDDLETYAKEQGGQPLEAFIEELEQKEEA